MITNTLPIDITVISGRPNIQSIIFFSFNIKFFKLLSNPVSVRYDGETINKKMYNIAYDH